MTRLTQVTISIALLFATACEQHPACNNTIHLEGKDAVASILAYDTVIPNTTLILPDSIVTSSSPRITTVLDTLCSRGLLCYRSLDSFRAPRRLTGPQLDGPDTIMLYRYALAWAPGLKPNGRYHEVISASFLGRPLNCEIRYRGREVKVGKVTVMEDDTLYFHQTCQQTAFRYTYKLEPANVLGEAMGFSPFERVVRFSEKGQPAGQTIRPAIETAGP